MDTFMIWECIYKKNGKSFINTLQGISSYRKIPLIRPPYTSLPE